MKNVIDFVDLYHSGAVYYKKWVSMILNITLKA
jgi:hypothetical protein